MRVVLRDLHKLVFMLVFSLFSVWDSHLIRVIPTWIVGTRFQDPRNQDEEENVVAEYEDQAHCSGHHHCFDSYYCSIRLWGSQMSLTWLCYPFC